MIFDGKKFAEEIAGELEIKIKSLDRKLALAVMVDHKNEAAMKYTNLKRSMANKLGVGFREIVSIEEGLNADGIIVQLPFPKSQELIQKIPPQKDADGLRDDSPFLPAVVRAVLEILQHALGSKHVARSNRICVVGSKGFVGEKLLYWLRTTRYELIGMDIDDFDPTSPRLRGASIVISCTGKSGLIKPEMVKKGFMAIDIGYPQAEFTPAALAKASWYTPVPGGVGPVTVVMLFKNLVDGVRRSK